MLCYYYYLVSTSSLVTICIFYLFVLAAWKPLCWNGDTYYCASQSRFWLVPLGICIRSGSILGQKPPSWFGEGPFYASLCSSSALSSRLLSSLSTFDRYHWGGREFRQAGGILARSAEVLMQDMRQRAFLWYPAPAELCWHNRKWPAGRKMWGSGTPYAICSRRMTRGQECGQGAFKHNCLCL